MSDVDVRHKPTIAVVVAVTITVTIASNTATTTGTGGIIIIIRCSHAIIAAALEGTIVSG